MELTPTGRMVEVAELQGAVVCLAAPAPDAMTGHNMTVDEGYSLW
jgi:sorbose reductase